MAGEITLMMDGRASVTVDSEEFEIIKLMVQEAGGHLNLQNVNAVINELIKQGYLRSRAMELCILARRELINDLKTAI